ncbi:MAG: HAD family hydrolase [Clostridia bacterium]|nr:HAD family hydrolase [Clostridia bacterium]
MKITTILFDLDGTLLPMDQEVFIKAYLGGLVKVAAPYGYDPSLLAKSIMEGTYVMVKNDGSKSNEDAFWLYMQTIFGDKIIADRHIFDEYYATDFQKVQVSCGYSPEADEVVKLAKKMGYRVVLATNPLFPKVATESRIRWAGLDKNDFDEITTFEDYTHCKPNLDYYRDIIAKFNLDPEECLMVGNDVDEDMITTRLGMRVFLLTDDIINKSGTDINQFPHGGFDELKQFIENLD